MPSPWEKWYSRLQPGLRRFGNRSTYSHARRLGLMWQYFANRPDEPDLKVFRLFANVNGGLFLDIGANAGQTIVGIRKVLPKHKIICFEPNPALSADLAFVRRLVGRDAVEIRLVGLAEKSAELDFFVPWVCNTPVETQASLEIERVESAIKSLRKHAGARVRIETIRVPVQPLDEFDLQPDAVKIDVEHGEMRVIQGALKTIERCRPVLLVENNHQAKAIVDLIGDLDYLYKIPLPSGRLADSSESFRNFFLIPRERCTTGA